MLWDGNLKIAKEKVSKKKRLTNTEQHVKYYNHDKTAMSLLCSLQHKVITICEVKEKKKKYNPPLGYTIKHIKEVICVHL